MAGFRKAKCEQAFLKVGMYGQTGSGKTATALLVSEGLARVTGKRIAYVDTERGTDFYAQDVPDRKWHPKAFDFDALYSRSLTEVLASCKALNPNEHGIINIDSISHLWDAASAAYTGKRTRTDGIPLHAWAKIKQPYKDLMNWLVNSPYHVFILGRQANEMEEDDSGEMKIVGVKMRAEKETPYEPHICIRMEGVRSRKGDRVITPTAIIEKDRTGLLAGQVIQWPGFDSIAQPLLPLLGLSQATQPSEEDAAERDAETIAREDHEREVYSRQARQHFEARLKLAKSLDEIAAISKEVVAVKSKMLKPDVDELRTLKDSLVDSFKGRGEAA